MPSAWASRRSLIRANCFFGNSRYSVIVVTTTRGTAADPIAPLAAGYSESRTMATATPASASWWESSRSVYRGLLPTTIAPRRKVA